MQHTRFETAALLDFVREQARARQTQRRQRPRKRVKAASARRVAARNIARPVLGDADHLHFQVVCNRSRAESDLIQNTVQRAFEKVWQGIPPADRRCLRTYWRSLAHLSPTEQG